MTDIALKIYTPEKTALDKNVYRVVLPFDGGYLTIIDERAPTSFIIDSGVMKILNRNNEVIESYFIDKGIADTANNECKISTFRLIERSAISIEKAQKLQQKEPHNADFYKMIEQNLKAFN